MAQMAKLLLVVFTNRHWEESTCQINFYTSGARECITLFMQSTSGTQLSRSLLLVQFSSVHFSRSVVSNSLRPHELQHARLPSPSPTPGVHSNSRPSSRWCLVKSTIIHCQPPWSICYLHRPDSQVEWGCGGNHCFFTFQVLQGGITLCSSSRNMVLLLVYCFS